MADPKAFDRERVLRSATAETAVYAEYANPQIFAESVVKFSTLTSDTTDAKEAADSLEFFKDDRASSLVGFNKEMKDSCGERDTVLTLNDLSGIYRKLSYFLALRLMAVPEVVIAVITPGIKESAALLSAVQERFYQMGRKGLLASKVGSYFADEPKLSEFVPVLHVQPVYEHTPVKKTRRTLVALSGGMNAKNVKPDLLIVADASVMKHEPFYKLMDNFLMLKDMRIVIIESKDHPMPTPVRESHDIVQLFKFNQEDLIEKERKKADDSASSS